MERGIQCSFIVQTRYFNVIRGHINIIQCHSMLLDRFQCYFNVGLTHFIVSSMQVVSVPVQGYILDILASLEAIYR